MALSSSQLLQLVSISAAFVSAMTLYYGSLGVPWTQQTWGGESPTEKAVQRRQTVMTRIGIPCALIAFLVQVVVILWFPS
jgi:hypothetical protein